jgi:hypothetical protein
MVTYLFIWDSDSTSSVVVIVLVYTRGTMDTRHI